MGLEEVGINADNWVDYGSGWGLLESRCEYGIEPPGPISHGVKLIHIRIMNYK